MKFATLLIGTCIILKTSFILCGCEGAYKDEKKYDTQMLIFGEDTIVIKGNAGINFSKLQNYLVHGHVDTLTGITYINVKLNRYCVEKIVENNDIKIGNHNGDIITGNKNVYK